MSRTTTLGMEKPASGTNPGLARNLDVLDTVISVLQQGGGFGGSDARFSYVQTVAATSWYVAHGLGKHPAVTVIDSSGHEVLGDVTHNSPNALTIEFSAPFAGSVYLN